METHLCDVIINSQKIKFTKMKKLNLYLILTSVICILSTFACEKDLVENASTNIEDSNENSQGGLLSSRAAYSLDLVKLATGIENRYKGRVSGFGYMIYHDGQPFYLNNGGLGYLRGINDAPFVEHSSMQRQTIASTTKLPTALLIAKLLEKNGKYMNAKIYPYLPSNWVPHPDFKEITFKQLLAHEAGLIKYGNKYAHMKRTVEKGIDLSRFGKRDYDNINYFLPHYMVAYMIGKWEDPTLLANLKNAESDTARLKNLVAATFLQAMRTNVFKPAGLKYWHTMQFAPWNNNGLIDTTKACKFYNTLDPNAKGSDPRNGNYTSGPGGLYTSATEYAQIMRAAARGDIVTKSKYNAMKIERLGFDSYGNWKRGQYAAKNGWSTNRFEELALDFGDTQIYMLSNCDLSNLRGDTNFMVGLMNSCVK